MDDPDPREQLRQAALAHAHAAARFAELVIKLLGEDSDDEPQRPRLRVVSHKRVS